MKIQNSRLDLEMSKVMILKGHDREIFEPFFLFSCCICLTYIWSSHNQVKSVARIISRRYLIEKFLIFEGPAFCIVFTSKGSRTHNSRHSKQMESCWLFREYQKNWFQKFRADGFLRSFADGFPRVSCRSVLESFEHMIFREFRE